MMMYQMSGGGSNSAKTEVVHQTQPKKSKSHRKGHHHQPDAEKPFTDLQVTSQVDPPSSTGHSRPPTPPGERSVDDMFAPLPANTDPRSVPRGLEYLTVVDQLAIRQKVELLEAFTGWETNNKYGVINSAGQSVYLAVEDNDCCTRQCCGPARPFDIDLYDNYRKEVVNIHRPLRCNCCCFPCQELEVCSTTCDRLLGTVQQDWSWWRPQFSLLDGNGERVLRISGPLFTYGLCRDVVFDVLTVDRKTKVGEITKHWTGFSQEAFTKADHFGVTFPLDLDVQIKATLLATTFLIDFMYFENNVKM